MEKLINKAFQNHLKAFQSIETKKIEVIFNVIQEKITNGSTIFWCGNGGSAAQASHLSAELIGGMFKKKGKPFKSICLNSDSSFITAWSNDDKFENIFLRQIESLSTPNDILICLSTSGNSENLIQAINYANANSLISISLTGNDGGKMKKNSMFNININSSCTQSIQEMHILIGHILCEAIEKKISN